MPASTRWQDLKGKPIATQPQGNTAELITQQALEVNGLSLQRRRRVSFVSYTDAVRQMQDGHAAAFTLGTTVPAGAIMDLASARDIKLLEILDDKSRAMRKLNPGYTKLVIPKGTYPKQDKDVQMIGYATHVVASLRARRPTSSTNAQGNWSSNKADLAAITKDMAKTTPKMMAEDIGVPIHRVQCVTTRKSARSSCHCRRGTVRVPRRPTPLTAPPCAERTCQRYAVIFTRRLISVVAVGMSLFHLWVAFVGPPDAYVFRGGHLRVRTGARFPAARRVGAATTSAVGWIDMALVAVAAAAGALSGRERRLHP